MSAWFVARRLPSAETAAADALGALPESAAAEAALSKVLSSPSSKVRAAAVSALGNLRATNHADKIRERLDDNREDVEV
ncbi:MAG TPA: HEAT repeat domain-containing protein, partial [Labilithrix sp.]|nr:HEAT repeat domain-containing protein [Labilithrix sp.]